MTEESCFDSRLVKDFLLLPKQTQALPGSYSVGTVKYLIRFKAGGE
jgi:hypothetical protein